MRAIRTLSLGAAVIGLVAIAAGPAASLTADRPATARVTTQPPPPGTLWVSNYGNDSLLSYPPGSSGNVAPVAKIVGGQTKLDQPSGVAIDRTGRIWTANYGSNTITAYDARSNGNASPDLTIAGDKTDLDQPLGIALAPNGNLWVANGGNQTLLEFAAALHGDVAPTRTISGARTGITAAASVAVTVDGKHVWLSDENAINGQAAPALEEFSTHARGDTAPERRIFGAKTTLDRPYGIAVGLKGDDPVTDDEDRSTGNFSLLHFASGAHGNAAPTKVIRGAATGLDSPTLICMNAEAQIWVPNFLGDVVTRFAPGQTGNATPVKEISGGATDLDHPEAIADFIRPPSAPRSFHATTRNHVLRLSWAAPRSTGGGFRTYRIRRSSSRTGPWRTIDVEAKTVIGFTRSNPKPGRYYEIQAVNEAGYSTPTPALKP